MNKDLKFLASILDKSNWPEGATQVRLDIDGEVCFMGESSKHDFYPDDLNAAKYAFVPACFHTRVGEEYSLQDILDARDELSGKPSWDDHDYENIVQNENGQWWGINGKPSPGNKSGTWIQQDDECLVLPKQLGLGKVLGDWRDTLERRPENHSVDPTEKVWRGPEDGLPPVGTECKISNCGNLFTWCRVKYMGERLCVVDHKTHRDQHYHLSSVEFHPIHSEEDKAVEDMMKIYHANPSVSVADAMRDIYRAGYRKQENPE